jgi:uncharacterized oxidoreductase
MITLQSGRLREFAAKIFEACGSPPVEAFIVADHLITANLMGFDSHGIIRIPEYVALVRNGSITPGAALSMVQETANTAVIDCARNFGQVSATYVMEAAIEKARSCDVATVITRRCSHVGRLGHYTETAARQGFLAIGFCNSPRGGHFVQPWGGREGRLATNPISFAFPLDSADPILADFSTAEVPEGVLRVFRNRGQMLPGKWVIDAQGYPSDDPNAFYGPPRGAIIPFGGLKGYRGYALSLLIEVMAGVLAGSPATSEQPGNGLAFIVIDTKAFLPAETYSGLISGLRDYLKSSPPAPSHDEVLVPGEGDFRKKQQRLQNGIPVDDRTWEEIQATGSDLGVEAFASVHA